MHHLDGAPLHWLHNARDYLDERLPQRWIGRAAVDNLPLIRWPQEAQTLRHVIFLWGYIKDRVYVLSLPLNLVELRHLELLLQYN